MNRIAFYKKYYEITNRKYADHIIGSAKDREQARRKGQINTSKTERGVFIAGQYFVLLTAGILFATENGQYGIMCCVLFLLSSFITDFSIMKMEVLYHIFTHNSPYAKLLFQAFSGKTDNFWSLILPRAKKKVSGFVRTNSNKFVAKYCVVFRKQQKSATIIISPFGIRLKSKTLNIVFHDPAMSLTQIADSISEILNTL